MSPAASPIRLLAVLWCGLCAGCASAPIPAWQGHLEEYVAAEGGGDLGVLRALGDDPASRTFGMIGASHGGLLFFAPTRTDATGVLLGHRRLTGRFWCVFLVGAVRYRGAFVDFPLDDPELVDVRLAACAAPDDGARDDLLWRVTERDDEQLERYKEAQRVLWRRTDPSRADAEDAPTTFPTDHDDLHLEITGTTLTVTDTYSNARWRLELIPVEERPSEERN